MASIVELSQRRARLVPRLRSRRTREKEQRVLVEGVRAVREALGSGVGVDFALVSPRLSTTPEGAALAEEIERTAQGGSGAASRQGSTGFDVVELGDDDLDALADTEHPQGAVLVCHEPRATLDALGDDRRRFLVVDAVQDPGNLGTLVRSAVAFGIDAVLCLDGTVDPWGAKAVRASTGLVFRLPVISCTVHEAVTALDRRGVPLLVAAAGGRGVVAPRASFALAVGNEGAGVRPELASAAASTVSVAMPGPAESLNVGIAGSILMHELTADRGRAPR